MGNLLASPKKANARANITEHDRAVLALKAQRKKLEDQTKMLERRIEQDTIVARTLIAQKKKERALLALKKKKLSENQLSSIQSYLMNVEGMLSDMELTKQQANVMSALKQGNEALKKAQQEMPLDDIQSLMEETAEAKDYQDKVQDLLSQQLDASDNEAVLKELQALEEQQLQEDLKHMPSVPTTTAVAQPAQEAAAEGQQQQQQAAAAAAETAKTAEQLLADEFPSVPKTKVPAAAESTAAAETGQLEEPLPAS